MIIKKLILIYLLIAISTQQCPTYEPCTLYSSGKITPISSFTTNATTPVNNYLIYQIPLQIYYPPPTQNYYYIALGVVGIQALSSNEISFNTTITNLNQTSFTISTKILGFTYCSKLSYHYLSISYPTSIKQMLIYFDCFLTTDLATTLYKTASQSFQIQTLPFTDGSYVRQIYSVISGMRLINNVGQYFSVSVDSIIVSGSNKIQHTMTTDYYNNLQFICLSTIVVSEYFNVKQYVYEIYYNTAIIDQTNLTSNINHFTKFQNQSRQFYGMSFLQVSSQQTVLFDLDTSNYTDLGPGSTIGTGVKKILLQYMYFALNKFNTVAGKYYMPDTGQCVTSCAPYPGYSLYAAKTCQKCYYTCTTCTILKLDGKCATCDSATAHRTLNATKYCNCNLGYVDVGTYVCKACNTLINQCLTCSSSTTCLSCASNYILSYDQTQCLCPSGGPKVNGYCLPYQGCILAKNVTNMVYCDVCDSANHFQKIISNYTCQCQSGYYVGNQTCLDICGDGYLQNISDGCDDGNLINGDGCSSLCSIQSGYGCQTLNNNTPSICSKIVKFSIQYVYSYRIKDKNSATMVFLVTPSIKALQNMNFKQYIQLSLPVSTFSATYDYSSSTLAITVDYKQNIEKTNQVLNISFDPSVCSSPQIAVEFQPSGINHELVINSLCDLNLYIQWTAMCLSYLALFITLISFLISKPILGLEMLFPIQITYIILTYFTNINASIGSLSKLKYTGGYNYLLPNYSYNTNYYGKTGLILAQQDNEFVLNVNYMSVAMLGIGIITIIWKTITSFVWKQQTLQDNQVQVKKTNKCVEIIKMIQFILSKKIFAFSGVICMVPSLFALAIQLNYNSSPLFSNYTTPSYNTLFAMVTIIFVFLALTQCLDSQDSKTLKGYAKHVEQTSIQYFFGSQILVTVLFSLFVGVAYVQYILFAIGLVPLGLYLYRSPYKDKPKFQRFTAFCCYSIITINSSLFLVADLTSQNQLINFAIAFLVLGVILNLQILTFIRILLDKFAKPSTKKIKLTLDELSDQQEQNQQTHQQNDSQRQSFMKMNIQKLQQATLKEHPSQFDSNKNIKTVQNSKEGFEKEQSPSEKHQSNSDSELQKEDQLQKIKKKLRTDLKNRRGLKEK